MKKRWLLAGCTSLLFACHSAPTDSTTSATHAAADTAAVTPANPVTATMEAMMHEMHAATPTGNNDVDFATMMLAHHKGAVEMARVELNQGTQVPLIAFAQGVITDQEKEIRWMQDFLSKAAKTPSPNATAFSAILNRSMGAMMMDSTPVYDNIDKDFAAQMIPHHQSAVDMAKAYLKYGKEPGLVTLSQNIVRSQAKEITWLKEWLAKNGK